MGHITVLKAIVNKISLLFTTALFVLFGCSTDTSISEELYPYNDFQEILKSQSIEERYHLVPKAHLDSTHIIQDILPVSHERGFDITTPTEGLALLYLWDSDILYHINDRGVSKKIAGPGNDPVSIQSGVRLVGSGEQIHLVQRARISNVFCSPECHLTVLDTYDHFDFIGAYYPMPSGEILVSSYQRSGGQTMHLITSDFRIVRSAGEYFHHPNPSLVANYNIAGLSSARNKHRFVQHYGNFPNIALFDSELTLLQVYKVHDFYAPKIESGLESSATDYTPDFMSPMSSITVSHPFQESAFWIVVAHQRNLEHQVGFEPVERIRFYDYYILDETIGLRYTGSSEHYIVPHGQHVYILRGGLVYQLEMSAEALIETKREVFEVPDRFLDKH